MEIEAELNKRIPEGVREGSHSVQFAMLIGFVRENNVKTIKELKDLLDDQVNTCRSWLEKSMTASTMSRLRREYVKKLGYFNDMKELVEKYAK